MVLFGFKYWIFRTIAISIILYFSFHYHSSELHKVHKILNFVGVPEVIRCSTKRIGSLLNPFQSPCYIICYFCFKSIDDCNLSIRRPHCQGQINVKEESLCCIHLIIECYQLNFTTVINKMAHIFLPIIWGVLLSPIWWYLILTKFHGLHQKAGAYEWDLLWEHSDQ